MQKLTKLVLDYAAYHRDPRNTMTHFVGVPIVIYSLFIPMGWFRFLHPEMTTPVPLTAATIFFAVTLISYLRVNWWVAVCVTPVTGVLFYFADETSQLPFGESVGIFVASFVIGWAIQLLGHYFEGRKPALTDNIMQVFNAPLFLVVELFFLAGGLKELKARVDALPMNGKKIA